MNASEADIDATAMQRVDNVFLRGVKAWIHLLLPNLKLKCDSKLKAVCSIMSMAEEQLIAGQSTDELEIDEEDDVPTSCYHTNRREYAHYHTQYHQGSAAA